ncbi:hypothetical protein PWG14_01680, partial (plasmid) [Chromobacterium amazonense]
MAAVVDQAALLGQIQRAGRLQGALGVVDGGGIDVQLAVAGDLALVVQVARDIHFAGRVFAQRQYLALVGIGQALCRELQVFAGLDAAGRILQRASCQLNLAIAAQGAVVVERVGHRQVDTLAADQAALAVVELFQMAAELALGVDFAGLVAQAVGREVQTLRGEVATVIDQAALLGQVQRASGLQGAVAVVHCSSVDVQLCIAGDLALVVQVARDIQFARRILAEGQDLALVGAGQRGGYQLQVFARLDGAGHVVELARV